MKVCKVTGKFYLGLQGNRYYVFTRVYKATTKKFIDETKVEKIKQCFTKVYMVTEILYKYGLKGNRNIVS